MTNEQEIYYAIKEAISVMTHYDTGEDFALVSSLNRLHELEQKLQQHSVMQGPLLWNPYPSVRPTEYGDYFVYRARKIHKETWNNTGWAYNNNTVTHWLEISGPTVGKAGEDASVSDGK